MDSYASTYSPKETIIWIPCFLFALTYLITVVSIGSTLSEDKKLFHQAALAFAVIYSIITPLNAYLQITAFRLSLLSGSILGLDILALPNPHSITWALEALGYGFLGLSTLFLAFAFSSTRMERYIKILFILNGIVGFAGWLITAFDVPALMLPGLAIWSVEYPIANILVFLLFRKRLRAA